MRERKKNKLKDILLNHINSNIKEYFIILILFFIGLIIGVIFINNTSEAQGEQITSYLNDFVISFKQNANIDKIGLLKQSITDNIGLTILLWFVGSTVIGIPIVCGIVAFRGFCLGYTISSIIATLGVEKGIAFSFITLGLKNMIFIPCLFALTVSGFKLYKSIVKDKRKENIKFEIYRHTFFSLIIGIVVSLSSLIETYVATSCLSLFINII